MADLIFVALTVGLFALLAALVAACDRLVGSAEPESSSLADESEREPVTAGASR